MRIIFGLLAILVLTVAVYWTSELSSVPSEEELPQVNASTLRSFAGRIEEIEGSVFVPTREGDSYRSKGMSRSIFKSYDEASGELLASEIVKKSRDFPAVDKVEVPVRATGLMEAEKDLRTRFDEEVKRYKFIGMMAQDNKTFALVRDGVRPMFLSVGDVLENGYRINGITLQYVDVLDPATGMRGRLEMKSSEKDEVRAE